MNTSLDKSSFQLKTDNKQFEDRRKSLFDQLDVIERNHKNTLRCEEDTMDCDDTPEIIESSKRSVTKSFRGKESIFKRPEAPISKCLPVGRVPDFRKNPQKWTKYTLSDVKDEYMTEKSNTAAAISFLKEIEDRRTKNMIEDAEEIPEKLIFKKTALIKEASTTDSDASKITFKSSKVVMPEYVVGQKLKKDKKNKEKRNCNVTKQLKLEHLLAEEEEN